jgi:hypothetical protein
VFELGFLKSIVLALRVNEGRMDKETNAMATRPASPVRAAGSDRGPYNGDKRPNEIEEDIARTRGRLSATIEALERELAPRHVIENGAEALRHSLELRSGRSQDQVWGYAIPLAFIATGLGWLFMLRRRRWQAGVPSTSDDIPADAVERGEPPLPAPRYADVVDPAEPVSPVAEKPAI